MDSAPSTDEKWVEIYKERYATFRHFDNLRWKSPTIVLGGGTALLGLAKTETQVYPPCWSLVVFSILCFLSAFLIFQIRKRIRINGVELARAGIKIGDTTIPNDTSWKGASLWFMLFLVVLGVASLLFVIFLFNGLIQNTVPMNS